MDVRLILQRKGKRAWTAQLRRSEATLGRAFGCTIRIPFSEVSRQHCKLRVENGIVTVEDLESINGTFINGERVHDITVVRPGDRLSLASVLFVVEYELTSEALRRLNGDEDYEAVAAEDEVEVVESLENPSTVPTTEWPPLVEPVEEVEEVEEAVAEPVEEAEVFVLDDAEEVHLPEGGDLRDFLGESDETDERSGGGKK